MIYISTDLIIIKGIIKAKRGYPEIPSYGSLELSCIKYNREAINKIIELINIGANK